MLLVNLTYPFVHSQASKAMEVSSYRKSDHSMVPKTEDFEAVRAAWDFPRGLSICSPCGLTLWDDFVVGGATRGNGEKGLYVVKALVKPKALAVKANSSARWNVPRFILSSNVLDAEKLASEGSVK
jgi:hypothetical protein